MNRSEHLSIAVNRYIIAVKSRWLATDDTEYKARKELLDQIREKLGKEESAADEDSEE
jgi:hypothetical protein